jgi:ADP-ribose pyrophosphatase
MTKPDGGRKLLPWKTLSSRMSYSTRWCSVKEDTVQLPNGAVIDDYTVVTLRDVAMVFALTEENAVPFVRQYRYGVKEVTMELPAGTYEKGKEDPEDAARRELEEETGYRADRLELLGVLRDYPTKDTHSITVYFTDSVRREGQGHQEETEDIENIDVPLEKIDDYIKNGEIAVAGSIAAIYLAKQRLAAAGKK